MSLILIPARIRLACAAAVLVLAAGCNSSAPAAAPSGRIQVVAAENFWGSIARQLGGDRVDVTSIVTNPAADPHDYEPTPADARTVADSRMTIVNGIGYDEWASRLLSASGSSGRLVLDVGTLIGEPAGGNPHRWYSPADVQRVVTAITQDYIRLDPKHRGFFRARARSFETRGLATYHAEIALIRRRFGGTPVGASESIFVPMAQALGLRLLTPAGFMNAISEGGEPTPQDTATADRQIAHRQIVVWVLNTQNSTPDVARLTGAARSRGIPVAGVTETMTPPTATFQQWQTRELRGLAAALARATGR